MILCKGTTANNTHTTANTNNKNVINDIESDINDETDNYHLTSDDLYPVPQSMKLSNLVHQFEAYWKKKQQQQQQKQQQEDFFTTTNTTTNTNTTNTTTTTKSLFLHTLWHVALPMYLPAGLYQFIAVLCVSRMPSVVQ